MTDPNAPRPDMPRPVSPRITLNDRRTIPALGYGVYKVAPEETERCVGDAIAAGYRHIDTAALYKNEEGVGKGVRAGLERNGLRREDVFVTSKVWNDHHGRDLTLAAFDESMDKLGLDYLDLYLIHWAMPGYGKYVETWKTLIELRESGRVRSIGVSNFPVAQLQEIIDATGVTPVVDQVELHPYFQQCEVRSFCHDNNIVVESWSPLGRGAVLEDEVIAEIARRKKASPAQVILAWHRQLGLVTIPKSTSAERMEENWASLAVRLEDKDLAAIARLNKPDGRIGPDPETMMPA